MRLKFAVFLAFFVVLFASWPTSVVAGRRGNSEFKRAPADAEIDEEELKEKINIRDEEEDVDDDRDLKPLSSALEESEVLKMLRDQAAQQDEKVSDLHKRLNKEIHKMETHFEEVFSKLEKSEDQLRRSVELLEGKVMGKVNKLSNESSAGGWKVPFVFLFVVVCGAGGAFFYMYRKATKHSHFL